MCPLSSALLLWGWDTDVLASGVGPSRSEQGTQEQERRKKELKPDYTGHLPSYLSGLCRRLHKRKTLSKAFKPLLFWIHPKTASFIMYARCLIHVD